MTVIIGIDPGSRRTGYGIIRLQGHKQLYVASGHVDVSHHPALMRLRQLYLAIQTVVEQYHPEEAAIEQIFMKDNPSSALKLGQARGAVIVALEMPVTEYSAREVKKSVVGSGAADKSQVQYMVARLLNIKTKLQADEADALAVALCHAQSRHVKKLTSMIEGAMHA
jgi:crossover junction endodeoxyribonuclease RuvC